LLHEAGSGQVLCPRRTCPAQLVRRIEHYVSPAAVNVAGFGPMLLEALVTRGALASPADLYRLSPDTLRDAGAGALAEELVGRIAATRGTDLWRVIHGLGIPRVGATGSRAVAQVVPDLQTLLRRFEDDGFDDLEALTPSVCQALTGFGRDEEQLAWVRGLLEVGVGASAEQPTTPHPGVLRDAVVVFTGTLAGYSRAEAADLVLAAGGRVASSVSGRTTLVVAGEGAGEKLAEARRRGLPIVGEAEFRALVGGQDERQSDRNR
jgi:DNA ligase (NAD+)